MKLQFKAKPNHRFMYAFWLGFICELAAQTGSVSLSLGNTASAVIAITLSFVVLIIYLINASRFEDEFLWMTIKNPSKVMYEEEDIPHVYQPNPNATVKQRPTPPVNPPKKNK
jgi:hypothetical protein